MQIKKLVKLHLCAHLKVRLIHICACGPDIMTALDLRAATAGERMFPSIRILPSRQSVHGRFRSALSLSLSLSLCPLDFYSWKHFKFRWQNWFDISRSPRDLLPTAKIILCLLFAIKNQSCFPVFFFM